MIKKREDKISEEKKRSAWADGFMQGLVARIEEKRELEAKNKIKTKKPKPE